MLSCACESSDAASHRGRRGSENENEFAGETLRMLRPF